jgi:tetratricopeptide (TPR) repeat protein
MRKYLRCTSAIGLFFYLVLTPAATRAGNSPTPLPDQLGNVQFSTSCAAEVRATIDKGVALLHSFQYTESEKTFSDAATRDPKCAMAQWGRAMALYHQLWDFPDEKTLKEGRMDIEKAQKLHPGTPREQGFIAAAAAFYANKSKLSHADRIKAYSSSLQQLHASNSNDVDISAFYALSLIALAEEDVDDIANRKKAISILDPLLQEHPDHPGVAHYLIHATDKPELASQGLEAARRYAAIAPDSAHALHMPSHIFVRLGLWQDSINSNLAAITSAAHAAELHLAESHYQTHAMDFLSYSYLQSGQEAKARQVIEHMDHVVGATEENKAEHRAYLAARTALELHRWKEAATLPVPAISRISLDTTYWARAIGAARSGDPAGAEIAAKELTQAVSEREQRSRKSGYKVSAEKATDLSEAEAWLAFAKGKIDEALQELRAAADRQDKNGGESVSIPAREMLADMLQEAKRPADALAEYKVVLQNSPNRFDALHGAILSSMAVNSPATDNEAQAYSLKFLGLCIEGKGDRPECTKPPLVVDLEK